MLSGIFYVEFKANNNDFGRGLIIIDEGRANGGDDKFLFRGRFDTYNGDIQAVIEVNHYRGEPTSVFGPIKNFTLNLSGKSDGNTFTVTGGVVNMNGAAITIRGVKVASVFK